MPSRRVLSALLLAAYLPACSSYKATTQPLASLTAEPEPVSQVRITTADSSHLKVRAPRVVGDTLHGYTGIHGHDTTWVAIPLSEIRVTKVRKPDGVETAALAVTVTAAIVVAGAGLFLYLSDE